jgi:hypothetical protein
MCKASRREFEHKITVIQDDYRELILFVDAPSLDYKTYGTFRS